MTSPYRLEMRGIRISFGGVKAIVDGSIAVRPGEIHALMGANGAGKSTLMNVLGGVIQSDAGEILIDGEHRPILSARDATRQGIAFVHQELTTLPSMSVAENIFVDAFPGSHWSIDLRTMKKQAATILQAVGCRADPDAPVETLSTGDRQLVEIARALKTEPKTVIFDEPTSSLSVPERERLFGLIRRLKEHGTSIIFISHFLEEVFRICDRVTVMRNGATISTGAVSETTPGRVVEQMLGSTHETDRVRPPTKSAGPIFLSVKGLNGGPLVNDIDLQVRRGEIVGLWGLLGSGRTELIRALLGLDPISSGKIQVSSGDGPLKTISATALRRLTGLVTEDRRAEGAILPFSIARNISLPDMSRVATALGLISPQKEDSAADEMIRQIGIKASSSAQVVETLSGGNQQKVVFARWLHHRPDFFVLDEPTRGLDTGAKTDILKLAVQLAEEGAAILMISSELEELMRVADRYITLNRGRIIGELAGTADRRELMEAVAADLSETAAA